jgi:cell wall-associated NlpC family hydrolase
MKLNIKKYVAVIALGLSISFFAMPFGGQAHAAGAVQATSKAQTKQNVIRAGLKYIGTPYQFGASRSSTRTFDCSSFTRQAFWDGAGVRIPADSRKQAAYVKSVGQTQTNWRNLQPGDLMFFMSYKPSAYSRLNKSNQRITHVGIYMGNGKILHTYSKASGGVKISDIAGTQWEYRYIIGGSAIK